VAANAPTLGLALIARDEEATLPQLLRSIRGAFDQVVLVDTGSEDSTAEVFEVWAERQDFPLGYKLDHFPWVDDFAAARNAADALLDTDWWCWADADDEVVGATMLREIVRQAGEVGTFVVSGHYHSETARASLLRKPRLVRRGAGRWAGRVNEARVSYPLGIALTSPDVVMWTHQDFASLNPFGSSYQRNIQIARKWVKEEPLSPRAHAEVAFEELERGDRERGVEALRAYLDLESVREELGADGLRRAEWALRGLQLGPIEFRMAQVDLDYLLRWLVLGRTQAHWDYECDVARTTNLPYRLRDGA
jgi:glycosyl transferase family 2